MPVTALPPAPRSTNLGTFSALADTFFAALPNFVTEVNAVSSGPLVLGTPVSVAGASAIDFTSIPSGLVEVNVFFDSVLPGGADQILVQVGTSAGLVTSGYIARAQHITGSTLATSTAATDGFKIHGVSGCSAHGIMRLVPLQPGAADCLCDFRGGLVSGGADYHVFGAGFIALPGSLDRVRVTRVGASNFTSGNVALGWFA